MNPALLTPLFIAAPDGPELALEMDRQWRHEITAARIAASPSDARTIALRNITALAAIELLRRGERIPSRW